MPATVVVQEVTGPAGNKTYTTITNRVRLFTADQATDQGSPQLSYPIPIPDSGFNYSYWKHICLYVTGTFTKVDNIRHYSDGAIGWSLGTGGELRRGNRDSGDIGVPLDTDYAQATGTPGVSGDPIEDATNGHPYYKTQTTPVVNVANDTSSNPALVDSTGLTSAGRSKAIVLQVKVASNASSGVQPAETMTWKYDVID